MNLVIKGTAQVAVVNKTDAILLMTALNESGCTEPTMRKEVIGKDVAKMYDVSFDNTDISVCSRDDAETVARWMLALDCEEVIIRNTDEVWAIQDVPNTWRSKTEQKVISDGYHFDDDGTAYPNE